MVTTVITIGFPLMPQKQGAVKQQGQCERAVVAQNRGSVVLFWVPTLKEAVPPSPPGMEGPLLKCTSFNNVYSTQAVHIWEEVCEQWISDSMTT